MQKTVALYSEESDFTCSNAKVDLSLGDPGADPGFLERGFINYV